MQSGCCWGSESGYLGLEGSFMHCTNRYICSLFWDDHEDRAYRRYLVEQHRSYRTTTGNTTECSGMTGTGATVIRTAINGGRWKAE